MAPSTSSLTSETTSEHMDDDYVRLNRQLIVLSTSNGFDLNAS